MGWHMDRAKWLKLVLYGGIHVDFNVTSDGKGADDWFIVNLIIQKGSILNYRLINDEALTFGEVARIDKTVDALLKNELADAVTISPIEPYMEFNVIPYKPYGSGYMEWVIDLWSEEDGGPSENTIKLTVLDEDIEKLSCYLKYVMGELHEGDIQSLISSGSIYEGI